MAVNHLPSSRHSSLTRRQFIQRTTLAAGAVALGGCATSPKPRRISPNEKLNIAVIGTGNRGAENLSQVGSENIVALCDVNETNLNLAAKKHPQARRYVDFRKLFDNCNDVDAVVVSTTEHTHAFATLAALKLGKHVYCEKPIAHSVWETRILTEAAAKAGVATQMGTQMHAQNNFRRVVELVQTGAIGQVREAHVWVSRAWGGGSRPTDTHPVPEGVDWNLWIGPAPKRAFHPSYLSKPGEPRWYKYWDFGGGTITDLGSHWNDMAFWALKLSAPTTIEAFGPPPNPETAPASYRVAYEHPAPGNYRNIRLGHKDNGEISTIKRWWYQGEEKPALWKEKKIPQWKDGALFVGDKGMLLASYTNHQLLPEDKYANFKRPEPMFPESIGHWKEWIAACKGQGQTLCPFSYSGPLTEANHLGNVAYRVGKKIEWDAVNLKAKNCPEADQYIRTKYHNGWKLG